jgi:hypothetical protein
MDSDGRQAGRSNKKGKGCSFKIESSNLETFIKEISAPEIR